MIGEEPQDAQRAVRPGYTKECRSLNSRFGVYILHGDLYWIAYWILDGQIDHSIHNLWGPKEPGCIGNPDVLPNCRLAPKAIHKVTGEVFQPPAVL